MSMYSNGQRSTVVRAKLEDGSIVEVDDVSETRKTPHNEHFEYLGEGVYYSIDGREFGFPKGRFHFFKKVRKHNG